MIKKLLWLRTKNSYPYKNVAMEEYLTLNVKEGECILYLWQNENTVVIGKNQNAWKECKVEALKEAEGYLVRRLSGGGAVYHDFGNLNFTFCVQEADYDLAKQQRVILEAVRLLGIQAEATGRNDITVDGRKFSGNAFLKVGKQCYHHGTILLSVSTAEMMRFLNVDKKKLQSKGVDSVRSRVANLNEFCPGITVEKMADALVRAFAMVYGLPAKEIAEEDLPEDEISKGMDKFSSWDWIYGRKIPFQYGVDERFAWGGVELEISVEGGVINDLNIYSDALYPEATEAFGKALIGCAYTKAAVGNAIEQIVIPDDVPQDAAEEMRRDMKKLMADSIE